MAARIRLSLSVVLLALLIATAVHAHPLPANPGWPQFHRDETHTGVAAGKGGFLSGNPPIVRWLYRVFDEPMTDDDLSRTRWTTTFPLGDLDGDGTLEIVVTTPDGMVRLDGEPAPSRVIALKDRPGSIPAVEVMWVYTPTIPIGGPGLDTYSPVLTDADSDGKLDVIFTGRDSMVRALKGSDGSVIWEFFTDRITEAGPALADLDGNGTQEVIVVTDCRAGVECPDEGDEAMVFVLPTAGNGVIGSPLWSFAYPYKLDSAVPAVADLDPNDGTSRKAIVQGTWGGRLLVLWQDTSGSIIAHTLDLHDLDHSIPVNDTPVIRTTPLIYDFGEGPTVFFGWLPTDKNAADARFSAIGLAADLSAGTLVFTHRWTRSNFDTWKSSPTLLPQPSGKPLIVQGYGLGIGPPPTQSGAVGQCVSEAVTGGIVAYDWTGNVAWHVDFGGQEGNVRASAAVADLDGDGTMEVVLPVGCFGGVHIFDATGNQESFLQTGPRAQNSPSIGDLDGDGKLEVVLGSYDGQVWALEGGAQIFLPSINR